jgi:3-methyladenine DNA glycosylase AlkD
VRDFMSNTLLNNFRDELRGLADPEKAKVLQRFFKTGKGEYGEGDVFLGVVVPKQRALIKRYLALDLPALQKLLQSPIHEERLCALLLLVSKYQSIKNKNRKSNGSVDAIDATAIAAQRKELYDFYLSNTATINNWDLVDLSAQYIVGHYLFAQSVAVWRVLHRLVQSINLWERRIAIVATHHFIRNNYYSATIDLAQQLLNDREDLMHKATGWMLREVGKRDVAVLEEFLQCNAAKMPRTMLRYAIEKFPEARRQEYLQASRNIN